MESRPPLRLWPGVTAVALQWFLRYILPLVAPGAVLIAVLGGVAGGAAVLGWWLFFSRAPWAERVGAVVLMVVTAFATVPVLHESIRGGMMSFMFIIYVIPALSLALVAAAVISGRRSDGFRRASIAAATLLACGAFTLLRTDGITGDADSQFHWRWTATPEERLLATTDDGEPAPSSAPRAVPVPGRRPEPADQPSPADATNQTTERSAVTPQPKVDAAWPGFRGPQRDGVVRGVQIETDWSKAPPKELWRRPLGPGWSSFAVRGDLIYTQEQRGEDEIVSCYRLATGEPVWRHRDAARFWESNAGAGPRATPTLHDDRVYTFGATGIVNALDAATGAVVWSRNATTDTGTKIPGWGFASSPLVVDDVVIVAVAGRLAAYDLATGNPRWLGPDGGWGYSSPHRMTIDGVGQILLLNGGGATSVAPADGTVLWEYRWSAGNIVQPAITADGDVLIGAVDNGAAGVGLRRVAIRHQSDGWHAEERWTSTGLKPAFNDFVVHKGYAFGFDGSILASIDLSDGARTWKGGRYGHGQLILLADQDLLLVLSEDGELALVRALPDQFTEVARIAALEGKTWNHPVLVDDILLVRNGEEMAAFRLTASTTLRRRSAAHEHQDAGDERE